jgi:integrase/recombinase XerD
LFRKTFLPYKECNIILKTKLNEAQAILKKFDESNIEFNFELFESQLKQKGNIDTAIPTKCITATKLVDYYNQHIRILEEQGRVGLAGLYLEVKRILSKFKPEALLSDVNFRFLESFEYWMRNVRGNKDTTISVKMRNLQRVVNQAIEEKLFRQQDYPFGEKKYSINKRLDNKTRKIAIDLGMISRLKQLQLEHGSAMHLAQQLFMFSNYSRGMNFVDMTYLKWDDVSNTTITYVRKKTGARFDIPVNEHNSAILDYFRQSHGIKGNYVFPILNLDIHKTLKQQYTRKKTALKAVNDNLKKLACLIGEPSLKLTTNVGRHSYATGLKRSGANTAFITEALGHATQEQTQTYLAEFEKGEIESWENKMFNM